MIGSVAAKAADLTISTKAEFTTGTYGTDTRTRIWDTPLEFKLQEHGHGIGLRIPYTFESGNQIVIPDLGPVGDTRDRSFRRNGLGNVRLSAWTKLWEDDDTGATIGVRIKLTPPAIRRLQPMGVGFTRVGLELNTAVPLTDDTRIDLAVGRRFIIGSPGIGLQDYWFTSLDLGTDITRQVSIGLTVDAQTRSSTGGTPGLEFGPWIEYELAAGWRIGAYVFRGFTRDSADFGGGFTLSRRFGI